MPKLKISISGEAIIKFLNTHGFEISRSTGSHIVLKRYGNLNKEVLIIPKHKFVKIGTLRAIVSQSARYISIQDLQKFFYTE